MSRRRKFSDELREEMRALRAAGNTVLAIALKYGISECSVWDWTRTDEERALYLALRRQRERIKKGRRPEHNVHHITSGPPVPKIPSYTYQLAVDAAVMHDPPIEQSALWQRLSESEREALRARVQRGEPIR